MHPSGDSLTGRSTTEQYAVCTRHSDKLHHSIDIRSWENPENKYYTRNGKVSSLNWDQYEICVVTVSYHDNICLTTVGIHEMSGIEKKISNVIFVFFWGTKVDKNIFRQTHTWTLLNPNIEHEMKKINKMNSLHLDATITQTYTHIYRRQNMHHQHRIGQMFMVFIVDPIELLTFVSFFSQKPNQENRIDTMQDVCVSVHFSMYTCSFAVLRWIYKET